MIVVVPFVDGMLRREVIDALAGEPVPVEYVELRAERPYGYAHLFRRLWRAGVTFWIVEQDTVPPPGVLHEMVHCGSPWCTVPHAMLGTPSADLFGCVKFARSLIVAQPRLAHRVLTTGTPLRWSVPYRGVALAVTRELQRIGYTPCLHGSQTRHLQPIPKGRAE